MIKRTSTAFMKAPTKEDIKDYYRSEATKMIKEVYEKCVKLDKKRRELNVVKQTISTMEEKREVLKHEVISMTNSLIDFIIESGNKASEEKKDG